MVLVSSGTHLVKNHESVSQKRSPKLKMLEPLCNQQLIRRQKSHEQDIIPKNQLQIDRQFFAFYRTHFMNYFCVFRDFYALGTQNAEETKSRRSAFKDQQNEFILLARHLHGITVLLKINKKVRDNYGLLLCIGSDNLKRGWLKKSIIMNTCKVE